MLPAEIAAKFQQELVNTLRLQALKSLMVNLDTVNSLV